MMTVLKLLKTSGRRLTDATRCRSGIAATEFALVLPVMTVLFFGMIEVSDVLTVKGRLSNATNSLADLVTQEPTITVAQLNDAITGVTRQLEPTNTSTLTINIISVIKGPNPGDMPLVHWSRRNDGSVPYAAGDIYNKLGDDTIVNPDASVIVVEMDYLYTSGLTHKVIQATPFDLSQLSVRWPRKSTRVQLCQSSDPATCTS